MTGGSAVRTALARLFSISLMLWLGASAVEQLRSPGVQHLRRWDVLGLVPVWTFFAPHPATGDFYVVCRDELRTGQRTVWTEIPAQAPPSTWRASIWNPDRRATKALFDVGSALAITVKDSNSEAAAQLSLPYLALITNICTEVKHDPAAMATQFMLLSDHGLEKSADPSPVFLSQWHAL